MYIQDCSNKLLQKGIVRDCITMCFDICTINIRVSIRVRGLHLVLIFFLLLFSSLTLPMSAFHLSILSEV